jgi:hypothetical protein
MQLKPINMKKIFILILPFTISIYTLKAQSVQLNESFVATNTLVGWYIQNNSNPIGSSTWGQGNGTVFPAYSGNPNDYAVANYNCGSGVSDISCFLVTPTLSLMNGGVLQFATRTASNPAQFADHLEVRLGLTTSSTSIGSQATDVGAFTTILQDINPGLTATGYPGSWTVYTTTLTNITGTVAGRIAFRYQVTNGGPSGTNSNYIGLDDVMYTTAPACPPAPVIVSPNNVTICPGGTVNLAATGAQNYTWSTSSNSSSILVSPSNSTVYSVTGSNSTGCPGVATATVWVGPPPTLTVTPSETVCPGQNVFLSASGASTYSWSTGSTSSVISFVVSSSSVFVVTGSNGPGCSDTKSISVTPQSSFLIVSNQSLTACPGQPTILGAGGATSYNWSTGSTSSSVVITPTADATYFVTGTNNGCNETQYIFVKVDPNLFAPNFTVCAGMSATLVASGASSYSWSTGSTASNVVVSPTATAIYTITGTSGSCSQTKTVSVSIGNNLSVNCNQVCIGTSVLLSGYGASSYTWQPINDFNQSVITTPTAPTVYTLTGKSGTCTGTSLIQVSWCAGVHEVSLVNESVRVYPNPFGTEVTIQDAYGDVKMVNALGQTVLTTKIDGTAKINTEELNKGIYFIIITNAESAKRKVIRVIKD